MAASPTSLVPTLVILALTTAMWLPLASMLAVAPWIQLAGSIAATLFTFALIFPAVLRLAAAAPERCEECGGEMKLAYSGYYDGWVPLPAEIVIYALTLVAPLGVTLLFEFPALAHFILSAAVLIAGTLFLQIAEGQIQGADTVAIQFGMVALAVVTGSILHIFWGWYGTAGTLGFIVLCQLIGNASDR